MTKSLIFWLTILCVIATGRAQIYWNFIPQIRTGQVQSITSLTTPRDITPNITDINITYSDDITNATVSDLQAGVSLICYQSWMTDTFSFNITIFRITITGATVRFVLLDNTFFTKARTHYIVVWRTNSPSNYYTSTVQLLNLQLIPACYLTQQLLIAGIGVRNITVGSLNSTITNSPTVVVKSMISGLRLTNNQGINNYLKVTSGYETGTNLIQHVVQVEDNNLPTFVCLTTVVVDISLSNHNQVNIVTYNTVVLNAKTNLSSVPYSIQYDGTNRMFFGLSEFNLTMSDIRLLIVETANISLVSQLYQTNTAMNEVIYNMFFFANRICNISTPNYDPVALDCSLTCPTNSVLSNLFICEPCHYSCFMCFTPSSQIGCTVCSASDNRNTNLFNPILNPSSVTEGQCVAADSFVDIGVTVCWPCNATMVGCNLCSSVSVCLGCISYITYTLVNGTCQCASGTYLVSGYCVSFPGCLSARYFLNKIECSLCDTTKNFIIVNFTCICNVGYIPDSTSLTCYHLCPSGTAPDTPGKCDDGNLDPGDGCDANCSIQNGYACTFNRTLSNLGLPAPSICQIKEDIKITYLYAQRYIDKNFFMIAFSLIPSQKGLNSVSFKDNFQSNLPLVSQTITFDTVTSTIYFQGEYLKSIEGNSYSATITFTDITAFAADPIVVQFTPVGVNAQLVIEQFGSSNQMVSNIIMGIAIYAVVLAITASVAGLKLVGVELLIPVQLIYFSLSTLPSRSTYSYILYNLRFANGFNTITPYSYLRSYSQNKNLVAHNFQSQFLLSNNITLVIFMLIVAWLVIHHFRLKHKEHSLAKYTQDKPSAVQNLQKEQLRSHDSEEEKQDRQQDQQKINLNHRRPNNYELQPEQAQLRQDYYMSFKRFTFLVDRIFFIALMIQFNLMVFGFIIMTLNVPVSTFHFSQILNVVTGTLAYFIFVPCIVFVCYDQETNQMINFTCMNDAYAFVYLGINAVMILTISLTFMDSYSIYLTCVLSIAFLILVIKETPYSKALCSFDNLVVLYLHIMLTFSLIMFCLTSRTSLSEQVQLFQSYIIVALIFIGEILTTFRLINGINCKKAFDDLKDFNVKEEVVKDEKKVIEKNLDLLDKVREEETFPPDSVRGGLFTPRDRIVDWITRNADEYENVKSQNQDHYSEYRSRKSHQSSPHRNNQNTQLKKRQQSQKTGQNDKDEEIPANILNFVNRQDLDQPSQQLNELQRLKKKLRSNLKIKKESQIAKKEK